MVGDIKNVAVTRVAAIRMKVIAPEVTKTVARFRRRAFPACNSCSCKHGHQVMLTVVSLCCSLDNFFKVRTCNLLGCQDTHFLGSQCDQLKKIKGP